MASIAHRKDRGREGWVLSFQLEKKRKQIWLGDISKRQAETFKRHVEELVRSKSSGTRPEPESEKWALKLEGRFRDTLASCGLCEPAKKLSSDLNLRLLIPFCENFVAEHTEWKYRTKDGYNQVIRWAKKHFGEQCTLRSITPGDIDRWLRMMRKRLSDATISKHGKRLRTMLESAKRECIIDSNPAEGIRFGSEVNPSRQFFVTNEMAYRILDVCPDHDWKLIFGLARFAGLRCPSEVLGLKWTDLDWETERMRIDSPKTGIRFCPMFQPLPALLLNAAEAAPKGSVYVVQRYRAVHNVGVQMDRLIERAGFVPWDKTFINLRSSCRTELQESFPKQAINTWLGHSSKVAHAHYLQTHEQHWERARDFQRPIGAATGAAIRNGQEDSGETSDEENTAKMAAKTTVGKSGQGKVYPGRGSNPQPQASEAIQAKHSKPLNSLAI